MDYEFGKDYAHVLITGVCSEPRNLYEEFKKRIEELKNNGINNEDFERLKKMIYGSYVKNIMMYKIFRECSCQIILKEFVVLTI